MIGKNHIKIIYILFFIVIILLIALLANEKITQKSSNQNIEKQDEIKIDPYQIQNETQINEKIQEKSKVEDKIDYEIIRKGIELNSKNLPIMVDEVTENFENTLDQNNVYISKFRSLLFDKDYSLTGKEKEAFEELMKIKLSEMCKDKGILLLFKYGITFQFIYYDKDYKEITKINITQKQCES